VAITKGSFKEKQKIELKTPNYSFISWCDFDLDGDQDLFVFGTDIKVFKNDNLIFSETDIGLGDIRDIIKAEWHDIDKNGYPDIIVLTKSGDNSIVEIKNYNGIFKTDANQNNTIKIGVLTFGCNDLDKHGNLDIVYSKLKGFSDIDFRLLRKMDNIYQDTLLFSSNNLDANNIILKDLNNDNYCDIVNRQVFLNDGNARFNNQSNISQYNNQISLVNDLNNDGYANLDHRYS